MTLGRRLKRRKREKGIASGDEKQPDKAGASDPLTPENLANAVSPFRRIFPWDFPGQNADWTKKSRSK
jgi:hypothetical protein